MEDVGDLEADAVHQYQIASDDNVPKVGGGGGSITSSSRGQGCILERRPAGRVPFEHQLALKSGRKAVVLGKPGRQMLVVRTIPVVDGPIMVVIAAVSVPVAFAVSVTVMCRVRSLPCHRSSLSRSCFS